MIVNAFLTCYTAIKSVIEGRICFVLVEERQGHILALLKAKQTVSVPEFCDFLGVSAATIRRDLAELEAAGKLKRVHGGASKLEWLSVEPTVNEKRYLHPEAKVAIAKAACQRIQAGQFIFLDAGTTSLAMIQYLPTKDLHIATNGIEQAEVLHRLGYSPLMIGGQLRLTSKAIVGHIATEQISQYRFDWAFMGMNGIELIYGLTTPDSEEAAFKSRAMAMAQNVCILIDASKFNQVSFTKVTVPKHAKIITNSLPPHLKRAYSRIYQIEEVIL